MSIKVIDSTKYHLWTDALHSRELARNTRSQWDRGIYVRWCVRDAWTAFETVCTEALQVNKLGQAFQHKFDKAVKKLRLAPVNWAHGNWQRVLQVYDVRKEFTHVHPKIATARLLTPLSEAEEAISVLRAAIKEVQGLVGKTSPDWVDDDRDKGWDNGKQSGATATLLQAGVDENDSDTVRIAFVRNGREYITYIALPGTPHEPLLEELVNCLNVPVSAVVAYRGQTLLEKRELTVRGA